MGLHHRYVDDPDRRANQAMVNLMDDVVGNITSVSQEHCADLVVTCCVLGAPQERDVGEHSPLVV